MNRKQWRGKSRCFDTKWLRYWRICFEIDLDTLAYQLNHVNHRKSSKWFLLLESRSFLHFFTINCDHRPCIVTQVREGVVTGDTGNPHGLKEPYQDLYWVLFRIRDRSVECVQWIACHCHEHGISWRSNATCTSKYEWDRHPIPNCNLDDCSRFTVAASKSYPSQTPPYSRLTACRIDHE